MLRSKGSLFARLRGAIVRHRGLVFALVAWEAFFFVDGLSVVEAREQHRLEVKRDRAYMAESFGIPAELWTADREPTWQTLGRELAGDAWQTAITTTQSLQTKLGPSATVTVVTTAAVTATAQDSSDVSVTEPTPEKPRPRRAAPIFEDGTQRFATAGASKLADKKGLPIQQVQRKAKRMDAKSAPPTSTRKIQPSPKAKRVRKSFAPDIAALAAELRSPAKIFRHIHDTVDYDPKWGADSPPSGTLWEGRGTSWDQAWLLQELLLAAGIDARLEWGVVRLTPELLLEITGVDDPFRAGDLLTTAGNDVVLVMNGTQVVSAHMPHVWVKAHVDYIPFRGSEPGGTGDTWVRMDPSFKTFDRNDGIALDPSVDFVLADHLQGASEDSPRAEHEAALLVAGQSQGASNLDDLKAQRAIHAENFPFVPGTLRTKIISLGGEAETVPSTMKARTELSISDPDGNVIATWSSNLPALYGKRLEIQWPGATSADEATLDLYGGDIFSTPPYELEVRPSILVNGTELATGSSVGAAEDVELTVTVTPPSGLPSTSHWDMFAGEQAVLSFDWGATPQQVVGSHSGTEPAAKLAAAGATYLQSLAVDLDHLAPLNHRRAVNLGTTVLAVQRGAVATGPEGTPQSFGRGPLSLETGSRTLGIFAVDGSQESTVPVLELLGSQGSIRESEALSSVFGGEHLNAVDFLKEAVRQGQELTLVEPGNLDAALFDAVLSPEAEGSVRFAVEQGAVAWIPESQLDINGWTTTGYIVEDPQTGAGGYFVTYERIVTPLDGLVTFHSISDLQEITAPTSVVASIDAEGIDNWTLSTRPAGAATTTVIATGTGPVTNLEVGQFDPTLLLNGLHDIVLTGRDGSGRTIVGKITVFVDGQMKIGHFTLSFIDLQIPLSGLDLQVVRTYDSRRRFEQGDFGQGWILDIRQGSYRNNRTPGDGWQIPATSGPWGLPCSQVTETKSHLTTVRLSDQEVYQFRLNLSNPATIIGGCIADASFEWVDGPLPGTKLEILGNREVLYRNDSDGVLDRNTLEPYVPKDVKLTTRDGRIFHLDLLDGVTHIEDLHGNALDITPDGISHTSGRRVDFVRDEDGRIVEIVDPAGTKNLYTYDENGDLTVHTDRAGADTKFVYRDHYLEDIENALGVRAVRTEYDEDGRMVKMIDAAGKTMQFEHDLGSRREVITNRLGFTRVMEYDGRGNVTKETNENGETTLRSYDARDNMLTETDPLGNVTSYTYTASDDMASIKNPLGHTTSFTYHPRGLPVTITDPLGNVTTNDYDANGNLNWTRDALGVQTNFAYNSKGELASLTDALGHVTRFEYDDNGHIIKETNALGHETTYTYDDRGNRVSRTTSRTLPDGSTETAITQFEFDELDHVVAVTAPDGAVTRTSYDFLGRVISQTDALGRVTTSEYDGRGQLTKTTYPDGTTSQTVYDEEGRTVQLIDQLGRVTSYTYDPAGRPLKTTYPGPGSPTLTNVYDAAGRMVASKDPRGYVTKYEYDAAGRRTAVEDAAGVTHRLIYDSGNRIISAIGSDRFEVEIRYDPLNRRRFMRFPDDSYEEHVYDGLGRRIAAVDQEGKRTEYGYDALGRVVSVKDALHQVTSYGYDERGNFVRQTDANGHSTTFEYDISGRQTARILPDGTRESFEYFADGNVMRHTTFMGATKTFVYDEIGRVAELRYSDGTKHAFTYTATGQRKTATDDRGGVTIYDYDDQDRLIKKIDPTGHSLDYTYDLAGLRTTLTATVGSSTYTTAYTHDALGRIATVTDPKGGIYTYQYNGNSQPTRLEYPNGVVTTWAYDEQSRLTDLVTRNPSEILQFYTYTMAATGQRMRIDEHDGTVRSYQYDDLWRLTQDAVYQGVDLVYEEGFTYDPVGNRLRSDLTKPGEPIESHVYAYDSRDRITKVDGEPWQWDAGGRLLFQPGQGSEPDRSYQWWIDDRLKDVSLSDGTAVQTDYDVSGNRVSDTKNVDGETGSVDYLVDETGWISHVVADVHGGDGAVYVRAGDQILGLTRDGLDDLYYHLDGLGSVRALSDGSGRVVESLDYSAFGRRSGESSQPYGFAGEPWSLIGLSFNRTRWLDQTRFVSFDQYINRSLAKPSTIHRYNYADGDPVNNMDPRGESTMSLPGLQLAQGVASQIAAITIVGIVAIECVANLASGGARHGICDPRDGKEKEGRRDLTLYRGTNASKPGKLRWKDFRFDDGPDRGFPADGQARGLSLFELPTPMHKNHLRFHGHFYGRKIPGTVAVITRLGNHPIAATARYTPIPDGDPDVPIGFHAIHWDLDVPLLEEEAGRLLQDLGRKFLRGE